MAATWDAAPGATSYRLTWRSVDGSGSLARNTGLPGDSLETATAGATATVAGSGEWQFSLTACNDGGCGFPVVKTVEVKDLVVRQTGTDYDTDGDGLIEIDSAAKLNAVRWDLDGDGAVASGDQTSYSAAFPSPATGMGCPSTGCTGYELTADIDLDVSPYNASPWWSPIGGTYTATFEGNGNTISNLTIDKTDTGNLGLFSTLGSAAKVRNLGLTGASVTGRASSGSVTVESAFWPGPTMVWWWLPTPPGR